eukprot:SAG31_NODE_11394_length_1035_cov_1.998932_2_plen_199_part_00
MGFQLQVCHQIKWFILFLQPMFFFFFFFFFYSISRLPIQSESTLSIGTTINGATKGNPRILVSIGRPSAVTLAKPLESPKHSPMVGPCRQSSGPTAACASVPQSAQSETIVAATRTLSALLHICRPIEPLSDEDGGNDLTSSHCPPHTSQLPETSRLSRHCPQVWQHGGCKHMAVETLAQKKPYAQSMTDSIHEEPAN